MTIRFAYPRPEYPRPDRQRGTLEGVDWINLNGPWQFRFDPDRRGGDEHWFEPDGLEWREQILVPFCWESLAAWGEGEAAGNDNYYSMRVFRNPLEVTRANHRSALRYEVGWYRRHIEVPNTEIWANRRVILTIGAADFYTDCWFNGQHLGHHEGGYTPFEFDLTDALQVQPDGRRGGLLVLRVEDPMDNHEQPVGKQWRWYTTTSGIWQTVFLEPRAASHIDYFRFTTDVDESAVDISLCCVGASDSCAVRVDITPPHGPLLHTTLRLQQGQAAGRIPIRPLLLWNPNEPHLYRVTLQLHREGEILDTVQTYFGMRKIDAAAVDDQAPATVRLNGVPRYLRGALYQSYHPDGVYTATDVLTLKNDIEAAKKFGFNFLRIHIKIDDPLLLYYADVLGILIMADFPNFGEGGDTPLGRQRFETMMREAIRRDCNHPSIIAWCLFNETWGFGGQVELIKHIVSPPGTTPVTTSGPEAAVVPADCPSSPKTKLANLGSHAWVQQMWELAKQLDPTRLIEDMSVCHWEHLDYYGHGDTDINSWHFYINDYQRAKAHIDSVVNSTFPGSSFNYVPGFQHSGQPLMNSEYGGIGALDGDVDVSWSFKFLTNELRRHGEISAYIYTELHDVEWEYNGFLNYDRTPKEFGYDPSWINESDVLPIDAPPVSRHALGAVVQVPVASSHFSSRPHEQVTLQWYLAGMDSRGRLHQDLTCGSTPIPFPHRRVAHAHTIELRLPNQSMLCTLAVRALSRTGTVITTNFIHLFASNGYPPPREDTPRALILRGTPGDWHEAQWSAGGSDREQSRSHDACHGQGHGFFEWRLPLDHADLTKARRLRLICEASSHRVDSPQTDDDIFPTTLQMQLNGVRVYQATLRNHPHDARGILSYLRGGRGAYGYLVHAFAENSELAEIVRNQQEDLLVLRCGVPPKGIPQGGLTIYGAECGGYPVCPTVVIEW